MAKGLKLKIVKVNGTAPTAANVAQGIYKIAAPFGLVWKGEPKPAAQRFIQFIKSAEGKQFGAVGKNGGSLLPPLRTAAGSEPRSTWGPSSDVASSLSAP